MLVLVGTGRELLKPISPGMIKPHLKGGVATCARFCGSMTISARGHNWLCVYAY